jgi:hypothetical protein
VVAPSGRATSSSSSVSVRDGAAETVRNSQVASSSGARSDSVVIWNSGAVTGGLMSLFGFIEHSDRLFYKYSGRERLLSALHPREIAQVKQLWSTRPVRAQWMVVSLSDYGAGIRMVKALQRMEPADPEDAEDDEDTEDAPCVQAASMVIWDRLRAMPDGVKRVGLNNFIAFFSADFAPHSKASWVYEHIRALMDETEECVAPSREFVWATDPRFGNSKYVGSLETVGQCAL